MRLDEGNVDVVKDVRPDLSNGMNAGGDARGDVGVAKRVDFPIKYNVSSTTNLKSKNGGAYGLAEYG